MPQLVYESLKPYVNEICLSPLLNFVKHLNHLFDPDLYRSSDGDSSSDDANRTIAWTEMFYETSTHILCCDRALDTYENLPLNTQFGAQVCRFTGF